MLRLKILKWRGKGGGQHCSQLHPSIPGFARGCEDPVEVDVGAAGQAWGLLCHT